ncbi:Uncharacterised protein [Mycobacteroides abscessus subsp. abscessus]|nr:Uncharacterised protein [Mycobacteroides abscessus subsp. abscessus]
MCTPSRRSVPGVLPDCSEAEEMSMMSSEIWKAVPTASPSRASRSMCAVSAPEKVPPNRPAAAISEPVFSQTTRR